MLLWILCVELDTRGRSSDNPMLRLDSNQAILKTSMATGITGAQIPV